MPTPGAIALAEFLCLHRSVYICVHSTSPMSQICAKGTADSDESGSKAADAGH